MDSRRDGFAAAAADARATRDDGGAMARERATTMETLVMRARAMRVGARTTRRGREAREVTTAATHGDDAGDDDDAEDEEDGLEGFYDEDEDARDADDDDEDEDEEEDEEEDVLAGGFARSMYDDDDAGAGFVRDADEVASLFDDDDDDDLLLDYDDYDDDDDDDDDFGVIDHIAREKKELGDENIKREVPKSASRHFTDEAGALRGRALYVCQLNWWLRVKNMQTYPPTRKEIAELSERTDVDEEHIVAWYDERCEEFNNMTVAEQARYEVDCARKQSKIDELVAEDFAERSATHFIEEDIFYDEGDLMSEMDMDEEPLTLAMERLDEALEEEEAQERMETAQDKKDEEDEGLDESQLNRIHQDGSPEAPFLINPRRAQGDGNWRLVSRHDAEDDFDDDEWLSDGGWDALPQHEAVSAFDGASLSYVGVQNEEIESGQNTWMRERALNTRHLAEARETDVDSVDRDPTRHFGDVSRQMHHTIELDQVLKGKVVAMDLYHGALVDCGTEIDALLPINETDWMTMRDHITVGTELEVKVTDTRSKWWRFRYPLEVMPTRQDLLLMLGRHPHPFGSPINVYAGETWEEACLDAGRKVVPRFKDDDEDKKLSKKEIEEMINRATAGGKRDLTQYEIDMLEAGVDDAGTNIEYTKRLEARLVSDADTDDYDDDEDELFSDDVLPLANEDLDGDDDDDDDDDDYIDDDDNDDDEYAGAR